MITLVLILVLQQKEKTTTQISHKYEEFEVLTKGVHF